MPQPRYVNTEAMESPNRAEENLKTFFSNLSQEYGEKQAKSILDPILEEYGKNEDSKNRHVQASVALQRSDMRPTQRLSAQQQLNDLEKLNIERDKALNLKVNKGILTQEDRFIQRNNLLKAGWPEYAADVYLDAPPGVKQTLEREHSELVSRGFRNPLVQVPEGVSENAPSPGDSEASPEIKPVFINDPETPMEKRDAKSAAPIPEDQWSAPIIPTNMTPAEKVKWENNNEKENNKELKETQTKKKTYAQNDILINSMTKVNDSGKLPSGLGKSMIDPSTGDIRPTAQIAGLVNPETQLYVKNLKQWLKGAKDFFGARVTNFDVASFMAQLPSLLNSDQGRRLILKQMKYVNDLETIHNNTLNEGLKKYGRNANYNQVVQEVDSKVSEREKDLLGKINGLVEASSYINMAAENPDKFRGTVLMQNPKGEFRAVPKDRVEALKAKKWRDI